MNDNDKNCKKIKKKTTTEFDTYLAEHNFVTKEVSGVIM